ncbi:MAG: ABC transporter permease [Thermoplasmatota archaeon]
MRRGPFGLALNELREHAGVYAAIVLIIALAMTVFTTQNAIQAYQDYVNEKTTKLAYGDYAITSKDATPRQLLARPPLMPEAGDIVNAINKLDGYHAVLRGSIDATVYPHSLETPCNSTAHANYTADGAAFWGVDKKEDDSVTGMSSHIIAGSYFDRNATYTQAAMGSPEGLYDEAKPTVTGYNQPCVDFPQYYYPSPGNGAQRPYPVIIGKASAELHNIHIGDVLLTNMILPADKGTFGTPFFRVIGIYEVGQPKFEELNYFVPLEMIQEFEGWTPTQANLIAIHVPPTASTADATRTLEIVAPDRAVHTQSELKELWIGNLGDVAQLILLTTIGAALLLAATAVKFVMDSVLVRKTREIGTLKALGATDGEVVGVFLWQALLLGGTAAALGYGIARGVMAYVEHIGLSVQYVLGTHLEIKFLVTPTVLALAFALPIAVALLAVILPATRAARLEPVEAMRRGAAGGSHAAMRVEKSRRVTLGRLARNDLVDNAGIYAVIVLTVAVALTTYGLQSAFQNNLREQVRVAVQDTMSGDAVVMNGSATVRQAVVGAPELPDPTGVEKTLQAQGYTTTKRTNLEGLSFFDQAGGAQDVDAIILIGIDPKTDDNVFALKEKIVNGSYFDPTKDYSQAAKAQAQRSAPIWLPSVFGQFRPVLDATYPVYPIIMGAGGAASHHVKVNDTITAVFNSPSPSASSSSVQDQVSNTGTGGEGRRVFAKFVIVGLYESGLPFNDLITSYVPLIAANELRGFPADGATAVVVKAPGGSDSPTLASDLLASEPNHQVYTWHDITLYFSGAVFDAMTLVTTAAIAITILLSGVAILYAMDATVKRKTREIGTLKALGATDSQVVGMLLREGVVVGLAAGLLALGALFATVQVLLNAGLNAQLPLGAQQHLGFLLTPTIELIVFFVPLLVATAAAVPPALRAARLSPVEALREGDLAQ